MIFDAGSSLFKHVVPLLLRGAIFAVIVWFLVDTETKAQAVSWCWGNFALIGLFAAQCLAVSYVMSRPLLEVVPLMAGVAVGMSYWASEGLPTVLLLGVGVDGYWYATVLTPIVVMVWLLVGPIGWLRSWASACQ